MDRAAAEKESVATSRVCATVTTLLGCFAECRGTGRA